MTIGQGPIRGLFEVRAVRLSVHAGIVGMRWPEEVDRNIELLSGWTPPVDFATMPRLTFEVYQADDQRAT
jgi:hypothetical protein